MYKDKKLGLLDRYWKNNKVILLIVSGSIICLIYGFFKLETVNVSLMKNDTNNNNIDYELILNDIDPLYREQCENIFKGIKNIDPDKMWSSSFEDWYIYHNFFKEYLYHFYSNSDNINLRDINKNMNGVYLDIGSYQPFYRTNTAFFDVCLGWIGICIWSPDLAINKFDSSDRSCNTINGECLWTADMAFTNGHNDAVHCQQPDRYINDILYEYKFFDRWGNHFQFSKDNKFKINLVSLKIEGAEADFLRCWPFHEIDVDIWIISTIVRYVNFVEDFMLSNGYAKFQSLSFERNQPSMIFIKKDEINPWTNKTRHNFLQKSKCTMIIPQN